MLRRYPYWGWLLLGVLLWCINGYYFRVHVNALKPERLAHAVNADLRHKQDALASLLGDTTLVASLFSDSLSESGSSLLLAQPFYLYAYEHDTLRYWNTNTIVVPYADSALNRYVVLTNDQGTFLEKCFDLGSGHRRLVVLFPVLISYPLENNYLHDHFVASGHIPVFSKITTSRADDQSYPVILDGKPVFFLQIRPQEVQTWVPDNVFIGMLIAAILASLSWIQLMIIYLTRRRSPVWGFFATLGAVGALRTLLYIYGMPFNLDNLTIFNSQLYASSKFLSSFGDLLINSLCFLWIIVFIVRHTRYHNYFDKWRSKPLRNTTAAILVLAMIGYVFLFVGIIRSLVLDSAISFDVSHFYMINVYSILGLLVIAGIMGISCVFIFLINLQLNKLIVKKSIKYLALAAGAAALVLVLGYTQTPGVKLYEFEWLLYWGLSAWLLLFVFLLDTKRFTLVSDLFEPRMVYWAIFICLFCTVILQHFNQEKERETRVAFVKNRLLPLRDFVLEVKFDKAAKNIAQDRSIRSFLSKPTIAARKALSQKLFSQYLALSELNKYQATVFMFDARRHGLYNRDSTEFGTLFDEMSESESTNSAYLFYKEGLHERHCYLAYIPVYADSASNILGYVFIDIDRKKQFSETVNSELLQSSSGNAAFHDNEYAYAIYVNNKLRSQTNGFPFNTYLKKDTLPKDEEYAFFTDNNISELHHRLGDQRVAVVIHYHSATIEMISLFSYLFVIQVLLAAVIMLYQLYLTYFTSQVLPGKLIKFTLRRRVHFSMLAIVLVSFILIGGITIFFFTDQYRSSNSDKLLSAIDAAKQSVQTYFKRENAFRSDSTLDVVNKSVKFKDFIMAQAGGQKIDINVFDDEGNLVSTSQDDIYNKGLLSHMIRPDAFYDLDIDGKSLVIQNERVAGLSYLSAYEPILSDRGNTVGFINIPFFSSEKDLNFQISNIVVTLINLYAFIFLLSSLITVFITRWITKSFTIIIEQFGRLNLQQNERISWPYDDEIGLLVSEYNKMVNKVEENAALLAQSERESAWREMARQVAHEIKNPLTPMKLNIQYLQQAMRNGTPDIRELMERVSRSIIEQIDNLSYIASEFSNFAKMPEARPGEVELGELLRQAVELYINDAHVRVSIETGTEPINVYSDRSQLLRVINNLLENARQSIPPERQGNIRVVVAASGSDALVSVSDNGEGIPDDMVKRIFQPYFTTKTSGTGLGLAMTKKIVEFWKGAIWFETTHGEGTTFFIRIPLAQQG